MSNAGSITHVKREISSTSWYKATTIWLHLERGGRDREAEGGTDRKDETGREGPDSDRKCPGLSPGLLSGRVSARLSACLSPPLLSILLKTICLFIIHKLLSWTDMFSLHRYFHFSSNIPIFPGEREGIKPAHEAYFQIQYFIGNFPYPWWCCDTIWTKKTNDHNVFYHCDKIRLIQ